MKTIAIVYDVDDTLVPGNTAEYGLISHFNNMPHSEFWDSCQKMSFETGMDDILAFMRNVVISCKTHNVPATRAFLEECGKGVKTFPGVDTWFDNINRFGKENGVEIKHFVISAGLIELLRNSPFAKHMTAMFASEFAYDNTGAIWPKRIVDYTGKTQYLFRISKGMLDSTAQNLNSKTLNHPIPFDHIVYIGDGPSDIPCMTIVKERGGLSLAVHDPKKFRKRLSAQNLMADGRVNFAAPSDYTDGSQLHTIITEFILEKKNQRVRNPSNSMLSEI